MKPAQFQAYYESAGGRLVDVVAARCGVRGVALAAVQEAWVRAAARLGEFTDEHAVDAWVLHRAMRLVDRDWAVRHATDATGLAAWAQVRQLAAARRRRGRIVATATAVVLLAALAAIAGVDPRQVVEGLRPPPARIGQVCVAPVEWRTALSPDAEAWPGLAGGTTSLAPTDTGLAVWLQLPDESFELWWYPAYDRSRGLRLDTKQAGTRYAGPVVADERYVAWFSPAGVKLWDGRRTLLVSDLGAALAPPVGGELTVLLVDPDSATLRQLQLWRYDVATGQGSVVARFASTGEGWAFRDGFFSVSAGRQGYDLYDVDGRRRGHATGISPALVGEVDGNPAWTRDNQLHVARDGLDTVVWSATTAAGDPLPIRDASVSNHFLVFTAADGFHVVDLITRHEARYERYVQREGGWAAAAAVTGGILVYTGEAQTRPARAGTLPDGGPRFTPVRDLPRITC